MAFAPVLDTLAVFRTPEVVLVLRSLLPAVLTLRFALFAAGRLRAVALMTQIAMIGAIELLAAKALAPGTTLHSSELKRLESPLLQDSLSGTHQNEGQANKTEEVEQNEEKFCTKRRNKNHPRIRFSNR